MRIGIVNDMLIARVALQRAITSVPGQQVAWLAKDGAEAVEMTRSDKPDLILMDLIMPGVDGVEATRRIMAQTPCPIVIVTSSVGGHLNKVYEAMGLGALDAVDTPELGPSSDLAGARPLLDKIRTIAKLIGLAPRPAIEFADLPPVRPRIGGSPSWPLVAIGASTGGPAALVEVLTGLPDSPDAATIIVQHLDHAFFPGLARMLSQQSGRKVELAESGERPLPGRFYLASTEDHLILDESQTLRYTVDPPQISYRPSIDVFFQSAARNWPEPGAAALLTGMMTDGAAGLLALRRAGWLTIAQDKESSVIWGMPGAAVQLGAAERVLSPPEIGRAIADRVRNKSHRLPGDPQR